MDTKFCCDCGTKIPATAKFCSACGERQFSIDESSGKHACVTVDKDYAPAKRAKVKKERKPSKFNKKGLIPLIRNSVLLVVAVLMLVMAFMPVTKISVSDAIGIVNDDVPELELNITPIRAISIMLSSFKSESMEDVEDEIYDLLGDIEEEYEDEFDELDSEGWDDLNSSEKKTIINILDTLFYRMFKLGVSVEDMSIAPQLYIAGALSLAYICAAIALLVVAILNKSGRDEQAMLVTVAGILVVMLMLVEEIGALLESVQSVFGF